MFNSGENKTEVKADDSWVQSATNTANAAKNKTVEAAQFTMAKTGELAQSAKDAAIGAKDKAVEATQPKKEPPPPSFLQQTGDQVMGAAQGAVDAVKNTFGAGDHAQKK